MFFFKRNLGYFVNNLFSNCIYVQYCSNLPELQIALISTKKKMSTVAKFKFSSLLGKDVDTLNSTIHSVKKKEREQTFITCLLVL